MYKNAWFHLKTPGVYQLFLIEQNVDDVKKSLLIMAIILNFLLLLKIFIILRIISDIYFGQKMAAQTQVRCRTLGPFLWGVKVIKINKINNLGVEK